MTANQIYKSQNNLVVIEVESTPAKGGWSVQQTYGGYTGSAYYRFETPTGNTAGIPRNNNNVLSFTVDLERNGRYFLSLRSLRMKEDRNSPADQENDYWVRVNGGDWIKMRFGDPYGTWTWATQLNVTLTHGDNRNAFYDLLAGQNVIEIAGRSSYVMLDRIHLARGAFNRDETAPPSPIVSLIPDPIEPTAFTIEAEAFTSRSGYGIQTISPELTVARILTTTPSGESAETSTAFTGESGLYTIQVKYLDENDGAGQISLLIDGNLVETLQLDQTTSNASGLPVSTWSVNGGQPIAIQKGQQIKFVGVRDLEEFARIDSISFAPATAANPAPINPIPVNPTPMNPTPVNPAPVEPDTASANALTIQAEAFTSRNGYDVQTINPDLTVTRLPSTTPWGGSGEIATAFTGESGLYTIQVRYLDENDGAGQLSLFVGGTLVETLQLNQTTSNTTGLPVSTWSVNGGKPITISKGDEIKFVGVRDLEEYARIDSISFIPAGPVAPNPVNPGPVDPNPVGPTPVGPGVTGPGVLQVSETNLLSVGGTTGAQAVKFTVLEPSKVGAIEVGFFEVDDAQGTIDGAKPGDAGYAAAALANAKTVFSTLGDLDIQGLDLSRMLSLVGGQSYGFFVTQNGTVDSVLGGSGGQVTFASSLFGQGAGAALSFSYLENEGAYVLDWDVNRDGVFGDFRFKVELFDEAGLPLGSNLQGGQESELLDLRGLSGPVELDMTVYREANNGNQLGFYRVENTQGTVLDEFGNALNPGDEGYTLAAVRQWASQVAIAPDNLSTLSTSVTVSGGQILVPFLISAGTIEQLLDGDATNDPSVFFPFLKANPGMVDHVKLLGNNTFAFEDSVGGGDLDYDDLVVKINVQPVA